MIDNSQPFETNLDSSIQENSLAIDSSTLTYLLGLPHSSNKRYHYWQVRGIGSIFLMARNLFKHASLANSISNYDSHVHMLLGCIFLDASKSQISLLTELFSLLKAGMLPSSTEPNLNRCGFILPSDVSSVRTVYTHNASPYSLRNSVPTPTVSRFAKTSNSNLRNHSYSSLLSCLENFLAIGIGTNNYYETVPGVTFDDDSGSIPKPCRRVYEILSNARARFPRENSLPVFCSSFITFHDDFDPTVSIVKANRHGVWDYHVQFEVGDGAYEFSNTYVLSLGPKGEDHDDVLRSVQEEINLLAEGRCPPMFHGKRKEMVQPFLEVKFKHGDQPDRRATNGLKGGKATNHARWRTSFDYKARRSFLPSCENCRVLLNSRFSRPLFDCTFTPCGVKCTSWSMDPKYKILHSPPPQDFPRNKIPSSGLLPPIEDLQYTDLIRAADETHQQVLSGNWNPKKALAYLSYFCLKTDLASKILEHSMNMKLYEYLSSKADDPSTQGARKTIEKDKKKIHLFMKNAVCPPHGCLTFLFILTMMFRCIFILVW